MLEQPSLFLRPRIHAFEETWPKSMAQSAAWVRAIVDPTTERPLGFATWDNRTGLFSWLGGKLIRVFESEDESLLMILARPWSYARTWNIFDAEEHLVGQWRQGAIYDVRGARLATLADEADGSDLALLDEQGRILGCWQEIPGQGCYFRFGEGIDNNPFVRMAALAAVLALPPWPGDIALAAKPAV